MMARSIFNRLRWPLAVATAIVVTSMIKPGLGAAVVLGLLMVAFYLSWSRTRVRRAGWPHFASLGFSLAALGLAALFGITTAYGALASVGLIETDAQLGTASSDGLLVPVTPVPARDETPTQRATATPTPTPTAIPTPAPGTEPTGPVTEALVIEVIDGDTIRVDIGGELFTVRYIGIDTPETVHPTEAIEWMGPEASAANAALVAGATVILEKDVSEVDRFDRLLRYVWLQDADGWLLVNRDLVMQGYALPSSYPPDVKYDTLFVAAGREARNNNYGLFGATPTPSPTAEPTAIPTPVPTPPPPPPTAAPPLSCHPSYADACLDPAASDYDCLGGSGDGPLYTGRVRVVGPDVFGLDRDGDGVGCE